MSERLHLKEKKSDAAMSVHQNLFWRENLPVITEGNDELRRYVDAAELPVLLAAIALTLRDLSILEDNLMPPLPPMGPHLEPHGGMTDEQQDRARKVALEGLLRVREEAPQTFDPPNSEFVYHLLAWFTANKSHDPGYLGQLRHELPLGSTDDDSPAWNLKDTDPDYPFSALIVGAGISGIAAAWSLQEAGIPFTWIEGSHRIGGTWWKNHYPGVRLDTPTYGYSFSFAQKTDWPHQFATGSEVLGYLEDVFERAGWTRDSVEFGTHLTEAKFDESTGEWSVQTKTEAGAVVTRTFNAIFTGVGQLDHPSIPEWEGQESYLGHQMHSQEWDHSVDLKGKRVAVIGTGASAYQIVPAIADEVSELVVFQRSAPWMLPAPTYHEPMGTGAEWLHEKVPHYGELFRLWVTAGGIEGRLHIAKADERWHGAPTSVSEENEKFRQAIIERYEEQYEDRPDLLEIAIPNYPPSGKRMLRDNGVWAKALKSPSTRVITSGIERFTPNGIVTGSDEEIPVDAVIYATGFKPSDYLDSIKIVGRDGVEIHDYWKGDAKGFGGITVPGFPNLFMMLGPNTGGVVSGSLHFMIERAAQYGVKAIREAISRGAKALDLKQDALDRHIKWVDDENYTKTWGQAYVKTWYKNKFNRVSQVWPFPTSKYWEITETIDPEDYNFI